MGKSLRSVEFGFNMLSPEQGRVFADLCPNVTNIRFTSLESCTPELWKMLITHSHLESLEVHTDPQLMSISSAMPSFSGISLPRLHTLSITSSSYRTDDELICNALQMSNNILRLNLRGCRLEKSTLLQIPVLCPRLQSLKDQHCQCVAAHWYQSGTSCHTLWRVIAYASS